MQGFRASIPCIFYFHNIVFNLLIFFELMANEVNNKRNGNRTAEISTGFTAILISFLVVAAIITNQEIIPDYSNISEDISFLSENLGRFTINTYIWLINAILIVLLGPAILLTFISYKKTLAYLASFLVSSTGIVFIFFANKGFDIIFLLKEYLKSPEIESESLMTIIMSFLISKMHLQLTAYTLAGLSAVILGLLVIKTGLLPRFIGWLSIAGGLIYATYGWVSMNSLIFSFGRLLFILSLLIFGSVLLLRGTRNKRES